MRRALQLGVGDKAAVKIPSSAITRQGAQLPVASPHYNAVHRPPSTHTTIQQPAIHNPTHAHVRIAIPIRACSGVRIAAVFGVRVFG